MKPSALRILVIDSFIFEAGISTESCLAIIAFRIRVSISAIGSETVTTISFLEHLVTSSIFLPLESDQLEPADGNKYDTSRTCGYRHEAGHTNNTDGAAAPYIWQDVPT
jgi:hypothetical protein